MAFPRSHGPHASSYCMTTIYYGRPCDYGISVFIEPINITFTSNFSNSKMKLLNQFIFLSLASGNSKKDPRSYYCDTTELELPSHAKKWDCTVATGNLVPAGNRCKLECDAGFVPTACKSKFQFFRYQAIF